MTVPRRDPLRPGEAAPEFGLPAVNREGTVSLQDYRGRSPVLVSLVRGLHCPFCRRHLVQLGTTQGKLEAVGVETLAVVNTPAERARLYFKYRPTRVLLAADPEAETHRIFGLPHTEVVENASPAEWPRRATMASVAAASINPTGELPGPVNPFVAMETLNKNDGFQMTPDDEKIMAAHVTQLTGQFLIDRQGIVRWAHVEAPQHAGELGQFPGDDEIVAAARALTG